MKKVLALVLLSLVAFLLIRWVQEAKVMVPYGEANYQDRVSKSYSQSDGKDLDWDQKHTETGSANVVTGIVTGFRSFDTLGEVTVLFVSALGISLVVGTSKHVFPSQTSGFILKQGAKLVFPIILVVGFYVITHGHLSPGGGFQGGAMIGSSMLLMALSDDHFMPSIKGFKVLEGLAGTLYVVLGLMGMILGSYFLENFLDTGRLGQVMSGGLIPIVYLFIGLKVGSELTNIIIDYFKEEAQV